METSVLSSAAMGRTPSCRVCMICGTEAGAAARRAAGGAGKAGKAGGAGKAGNAGGAGKAGGARGDGAAAENAESARVAKRERVPKECILVKIVGGR